MLSKKMTFSLMSLYNITCICFRGTFRDGRLMTLMPSSVLLTESMHS